MYTIKTARRRLVTRGGGGGGCIILSKCCECGLCGVEITVAPRFIIPLLTVACRTATGRRGDIYNTQERATKICLVGPLGVSIAQGAVARWDGNVALQRWGCGRCRPGDGGRGYRFTIRLSLYFVDIKIIARRALPAHPLHSLFAPDFLDSFVSIVRIMLLPFCLRFLAFFLRVHDDWSTIIFPGVSFFRKESNKPFRAELRSFTLLIMHSFAFIIANHTTLHQLAAEHCGAQCTTVTGALPLSLFAVSTPTTWRALSSASIAPQ